VRTIVTGTDVTLDRGFAEEAPGVAAGRGRAPPRAGGRGRPPSSRVDAAGVANVWAVEVEPNRMFAYELRRPGRFFRVEFDLARPVALPPPPWGSN
jgi:hypothetical protein